MTVEKGLVYFLLVDDLEENLLALEGLLRRDRLILLKARSGVEALEYLLKFDVALAFIDIQMPVMDGFELAELMRGSERTRRVPIIFLTAGETDRNRRFRGYEAGAVDFLQKPLEAHILKSKADVFFELFRQRQEVAIQRDELQSATEEITRLLNESRQYSLALKEADRRKDDFLAMLAHELRNPLAPVRNAVEILKLSGPANEIVSKAREIISRQVTHMARLVDDLLDVARISRGKIQLRTERCDLATIIRQTVEDYRSAFTEIGVTVNLSLPDHSLPIVGDPIRLAQVIGNLLHNAVKFTPEGGTVDVRVECDAARPQAIITVKDTGIGLDPSVLSRLFEPFTQANQKLDREKGGLGLGLALVKGLVELHSGSVEAQSEGIGKGATFILRVPLSDTELQSVNSAARVAAQLKGNGMKILLVEDNHDAASSMKMLLSLQGHYVNVAYDGSEGLSIARVAQPDVVISDLGLPGTIDGYQVASTLRQEFPEMYLIALSGYGRDDDMRRTQDTGFDEHLVKPVDPADLDSAIETARKKRNR